METRVCAGPIAVRQYTDEDAALPPRPLALDHDGYFTESEESMRNRPKSFPIHSGNIASAAFAQRQPSQPQSRNAAFGQPPPLAYYMPGMPQSYPMVMPHFMTHPVYHTESSQAPSSMHHAASSSSSSQGAQTSTSSSSEPRPMPALYPHPYMLPASAYDASLSWLRGGSVLPVSGYPFTAYSGGPTPVWTDYGQNTPDQWMLPSVASSGANFRVPQNMSKATSVNLKDGASLPPNKRLRSQVDDEPHPPLPTPLPVQLSRPVKPQSSPLPSLSSKAVPHSTSKAWNDCVSLVSVCLERHGAGSPESSDSLSALPLLAAVGSAMHGAGDHKHIALSQSQPQPRGRGRPRKLTRDPSTSSARTSDAESCAASESEARMIATLALQAMKASSAGVDSPPSRFKPVQAPSDSPPAPPVRKNTGIKALSVKTKTNPARKPKIIATPEQGLIVRGQPNPIVPVASSFPELENKMVICDQCWSEAHIRGHSQNAFICYRVLSPAPNLATCVCDVCGGQLDRPPVATAPVTGRRQRPTYECHRCTATFSRGDRLIAHSGLHTGKRVFGCPICLAVFSRKSRLKGHMFRHAQREAMKTAKVGKVANTSSVSAADEEEEDPDLGSSDGGGDDGEL